MTQLADRNQECRSGWSFCFVTGGTNDLEYLECLRSIDTEFSARDDYEIISVGTSSIKQADIAKLKTVHFSEPFVHLSWRNFRRVRKTKNLTRLFMATGAICHKKNIAARTAQFDKLCILHDYVSLEPGWRVGFERFGDTWTVAMNTILNKDNSRHRDWMNWDHPTITPSGKNNSACLQPYEITTRNMYIGGTYFCVKRDFFLKNSLDENLFWGDGEDVEWSLRVREQTKFQFNPYATVKYTKLKDTRGAPYDLLWQKHKEEFDNAVANGTITSI